MYAEYDIKDDIMIGYTDIIDDILYFTHDIIPQLTDIWFNIMAYIIAYNAIHPCLAWTLAGAASCFNRKICLEDVY